MMITGVIETFAICRFISFSLVVIFIIRIFSTSALRVPEIKKQNENLKREFKLLLL